MRRVWISGGRAITALIAAASLSSCATPTLRAPDRPPNVLLITIDTLRADAIGAYGNAQASTPWMDRLAAAGVRFDAAHAHNVVTLPSHANILSGIYPTDHGVRDNAGYRLPDTVPTLATLLKARGYATGAFVSAFPLASRFGLARGFDVYDDSFVDATPRTPLLEQERPGVDTVARAKRWRDGQRDRPTFVWLHLFEPHAPYASYGGDVTAADSALAPLLGPVLDRGSPGNTVVVLTADHGESLGEHEEATHGVFAYESTLRVPLIVYAPRRLTPQVIAGPARHVDVAPTILDAAGAPAETKMRGHSLLQSDGRPANGGSPMTYFESLSPALNRGWAPLRGIVRGQLKYIDLPVPELYDLAADPRETANLAATRAADVRALHDELAAFTTTPPAASRTAESADTIARLRSLGYTAGTAPTRDRHSERDDPKRLMALDRRLQDAVRLHSSGNRDQALAVARELVRDAPRMRVAWMTLAQIQRDRQDLDAAIDSMRRAHALSPWDAETTSLLGAYLTERGRPAEAIALLVPAAGGADADVQVLVTLGLAQARAGQLSEAVSTIERARAANPSNARLLIDLGTVQLIANRRDAARRSFEDAVSRNPDLARGHSSLAAMAVEAGQNADAIARWREATRLDQSEFRRIFLLGMALDRARKPDAARACFAFVADHAPAREYGREIEAARAWLRR